MTPVTRGGWVGIVVAALGCMAASLSAARAADGETQAYASYGWKPEYERLPRTFGEFAIVPGKVEGLPAVCIKQRNGAGSSPYLFDLPGGGVEAGKDRDPKDAVVREALEELNLRCEVVAAIGEPLYYPVKHDGSVVRVNCAQAYLVRTKDTPNPRSEALSVAFVHARSLAGFKIAAVATGPRPAEPGRTPVMIFDGLSVLQRPSTMGS